MKPVIGILLMVSALRFSEAASAEPPGDRCSTAMLAGRWVFATGIGHQALANAPAPGDVTAIGTMNIRRNGDVEGVFDVTFEGAAFRAGVSYSGTVSVNADCTGTVSFVTAAGTARTDSIVVLNRYELLGMSRDPKNLWTYEARRLAGRIGFSVD